MQKIRLKTKGYFINRNQLWWKWDIVNATNKILSPI